MSLKIAFISSEFLPDGGGGIGTYSRQAAAELARRGHKVEVFTSGKGREPRVRHGEVDVHIINESDPMKFAAVVLPVFARRHVEIKFDVIEAAEYMADGREVRRVFPEIPHVVKLHTPVQMIQDISLCQPTVRGLVNHHFRYCKQMFNMVCAGKRPARYPPFEPHIRKPVDLESLERRYAQAADLTVSPSAALRDWAIEHWSLPAENMMVVPNPYTPPARHVVPEVRKEGKVVGYFGRLEQRKGINDLAAAIPIILAAEPQARFRFVGKSMPNPATLENFDAYLLRILKRFRHALEFRGPCPSHQMAEEFDAVDICVFPSLWENFPYVCLEAMAADRAIVASNAGGMTEMLENGKHGLLVSPHNPAAMAEAVVRLLRSPELRLHLGMSAQKRVECYSADKIGPLIERSYKTAIQKSKARGENFPHAKSTA